MRSVNAAGKLPDILGRRVTEREEGARTCQRHDVDRHDQLGDGQFDRRRAWARVVVDVEREASVPPEQIDAREVRNEDICNSPESAKLDIDLCLIGHKAIPHNCDGRHYETVHADGHSSKLAYPAPLNLIGIFDNSCAGLAASCDAQPNFGRPIGAVHRARARARSDRSGALHPRVETRVPVSRRFRSLAVRLHPLAPEAARSDVAPAQQSSALSPFILSASLLIDQKAGPGAGTHSHATITHPAPSPVTRRSPEGHSRQSAHRSSVRSPLTLTDLSERNIVFRACFRKAIALRNIA